MGIVDTLLKCFKTEAFTLKEAYEKCKGLIKNRLELEYMRDLVLSLKSQAEDYI